MRRIRMHGEILVGRKRIEPDQVHRVMLEHLVVDRGEPIILDGEIGAAMGQLAPPRHPKPAQDALQGRPLLLMTGFQRRADDGRQVADILRHKEIGLHEALDSRQARALAIAEFGGHLALQVERQPLFGATGDAVHQPAHPPQEILGPLECGKLLHGKKAGPDELFGILDPVSVFGDPEQGVEVTQATLAILDVRLDHVARRTSTADAGFAFDKFGVHEIRRRVLDDFEVKPSAEVIEQRRVAADEPRFQQRGADGHVSPRLTHAVIDRARGMPNFQFQIPQRVKNALHDALAPARLLVRKQEQHIDI